MAFLRKQNAWDKYNEVKESCKTAKDDMQTAWDELTSARDEMNREYAAIQLAHDYSRETWDAYGRVRDANNAEIERLRTEADAEHSEMASCFERAKDCYEYGDRAEAPVWSQRGHEHKARRDELNDRIRELGREVKDAKSDAKLRALRANSSSFKAAKEAFEAAKDRHKTARTEYLEQKMRRNRLKTEFEAAQEEYLQLKELTEKAVDSRQKENELTLDVVDKALIKVDKPFMTGRIFGQRAKIVSRDDGSGKTDVYFAGLEPAGDGIGHGHAVIDKDGNVTYLRDAWQEHDDYLIDDNPRRRRSHNI